MSKINTPLTEDSVRKIVKEELKEEIKGVKEEMKDIKDSIKFLPTKDEYYAKASEIMGEIKAMREELTVVTGYKDQIEDHETRIEKLEDVLEPTSTTS